MRTMTRLTMLTSGLAACGLVGVSAAMPTPITHESVLVEDFTATWCSPCAYAHDLLDRAKDRWGDDIALLTYNISDPPLSNSYTERRGNEWNVTAIPTFGIHGSIKQVGTPSDQQFDNYIRQCQDLPKALDVLANYTVDPNTQQITVNIKLRPTDRWLTESYQLRFVAWERQYLVNWYRSDYKYRVCGGVDVQLPTVPLNKVGQGRVVLDLKTMGPHQEIDDIGVTAYLYHTGTKEISAAWEIGKQSLGDLNNDLNIDKKDANLFKKQLGKDVNDPGFNPAADWDRDDDVDADDTALFRAYINSGGLR